MKFGTLLSDLAKKAGVDTTQKEFVDLLATDIEIPDAIANGLNKGLLNIEAAKNNPDVKKAIKAEALNGVDSKISELLEEYGITEADDITNEKNSFNKIALLTKKIKEAESKKAGTGKKEEKDALELKISDLNKELKLAKEGLTAKEKEWQETRNSDLIKFEKQKKLLGKDYALPKEMSTDLKVTTAEAALDMALAAKGFKLVRNEQGGLSVVDKDGNKAYNENHEEVQADKFIDGALAQNKLLKVNDPSQNGGGNNGHDQPIIPNNGQKGNQNTVNAIDQQMKDLNLV